MPNSSNQSGGLGLNPNATTTASAGNELLAPRYRFGNSSAARSGRAESGLHQLHALDAIATHDFDRLAVEQKFDAFFPAVPVVAPRARHVELVTPVRAGHRFRALANRSPIAIHAGITATQNDDALASQIDEGG